MKIILTTILFTLALSPAYASGSHSGGHDAMMDIGMPAKVSWWEWGMKKVTVSLIETDNGEMLFEPKEFSFKAGQTVQFTITNDGDAEHEFVLDTLENNAKHKELMAKFPEMEYDDPNAIRLQPGDKGTIVWNFANAGTFEVACLIPGHYEAGMHAALTVK